MFENNVLCSSERWWSLHVYQLKLTNCIIQILYVVIISFPLCWELRSQFNLTGNVHRYVSRCSAVSFCSLYIGATLLDTHRFFIFLNCNSLTSLTLVVSRNLGGQNRLFFVSCQYCQLPFVFSPRIYFCYLTFNLSVPL